MRNNTDQHGASEGDESMTAEQWEHEKAQLRAEVASVRAEIAETRAELDELRQDIADFADFAEGGVE